MSRAYWCLGIPRETIERANQHWRFALATRDAHGLYAQFGFAPLKHPDRMMEIARPDIYRA